MPILRGRRSFVPTARRRTTPHARHQHTACSHRRSHHARRLVVKRDVLALIDGLTKRDSPTSRAGMTPVQEPDEPTWEVRQPNRSGMGRFDGRTRSILTVAAVIAVIV